MLRIVKLSVALATACVLVPSVAAAQDACKKLTSEQDAFTGERVTRLSAAEASERQINSAGD
ncbi:MAG: hypothetical protein H6733_16120 [Alphaproteobacteria bacterium]|nr:hypothetical protein [Alphaproteobacteria bacterium]